MKSYKKGFASIILILIALVVILIGISNPASASLLDPNNPPLPNRYQYNYSYTLNENTLPSGVAVVKKGEIEYVVNTSDTPLVLTSESAGKVRLVSGKTFNLDEINNRWMGEGETVRFNVVGQGTSATYASRIVHPFELIHLVYNYTNDNTLHKINQAEYSDKAISPRSDTKQFTVNATYGETPAKIKGSISYNVIDTQASGDNPIIKEKQYTIITIGILLLIGLIYFLIKKWRKN